MPTGVFTAWKAPLGSLPANTGTLTVDSYAAKVSAFSMDMSTEISHAIWMNNETISPIDRKPKGSITVEAIAVATKDYFAMVRAATLGVFTLTHGTAAGYKVKLDAPKLQLADVQEVEYAGALAFQFSTTFSPNAGNDSASGVKAAKAPEVARKAPQVDWTTVTDGQVRVDGTEPVDGDDDVRRADPGRVGGPGHLRDLLGDEVDDAGAGESDGEAGGGVLPGAGPDGFGDRGEGHGVLQGFAGLTVSIRG